MPDPNGSISNPAPADPRTVDELLDRIVRQHHMFTRSSVSGIAGLTKKLSGMPLESFPAFAPLHEAVTILSNDLMAHLQKEETVLFPYIERLGTSASDNAPVPQPAFGSVANPIRMMRLEHEETDNVLKRIRHLTDEYTLPDEVPPELRELFQILSDLDADLREHIRLEDELLFPLAVRLEQEASGRA